MEMDYEFVELRVAYPGHPRVALIDGIDLSGNLKRIWCVADQFFHRREGIGTARQEQVYRIPTVAKIWEVKERIGEQTRYRYLTVFGGALCRIDYESVVAVFRRKMSLREAVRSCRSMDVGPDYDEIGLEDDSDHEPFRPESLSHEPHSDAADGADTSYDNLHPLSLHSHDQHAYCSWPLVPDY